MMFNNKKIKRALSFMLCFILFMGLTESENSSTIEAKSKKKVVNENIYYDGGDILCLCPTGYFKSVSDYADYVDKLKIKGLERTKGEDSTINVTFNNANIISDDMEDITGTGNKRNVKIPDYGKYILVTTEKGKEKLESDYQKPKFYLNGKEKINYGDGLPIYFDPKNGTKIEVKDNISVLCAYLNDERCIFNGKNILKAGTKNEKIKLKENEKNTLLAFDLNLNSSTIELFPDTESPVIKPVKQSGVKFKVKNNKITISYKELPKKLEFELIDNAALYDFNFGRYTIDADPAFYQDLYPTSEDDINTDVILEVNAKALEKGAKKYKKMILSDMAGHYSYYEVIFKKK